MREYWCRALIPCTDFELEYFTNYTAIQLQWKKIEQAKLNGHCINPPLLHCQFIIIRDSRVVIRKISRKWNHTLRRILEIKASNLWGLYNGLMGWHNLRIVYAICKSWYKYLPRYCRNIWSTYWPFNGML